MISDSITIIVPVYNGECFVKECVDMIRAQTYPYWECIFVDDGSTDGTHKLLINSIEDDNRFRVLKQNNSGVSSARNRGLSEASHELITFVDVDDCIHPMYLEILLALLRDNDAQVSCCDVLKIKERVSHKVLARNKNEIILFNGVEAVRDMFYRRRVQGYACAKLFVKEIIDFNFPENLKYGEDSVWLYNVLSHCPRVVWSSMELYLYYQHSGSSTHCETDIIGWKKLYDILTNEIWEDVIKSKSITLNALRNDVFIRALNIATRMQGATQGVGFAQEIYKYIDDNKYLVLTDTYAKRAVRLLAFIGSFVGVKRLVSICAFLRGLENRGVFQRKKGL